ncbi:hypothetical protein QYF36_014495 [Acer negundo]|nr:hypothetical protein QYF36_014495 [Acer negundo]
MSASSNFKKAYDSSSSSRSVEASNLVFKSKKRKEHPLSDTEGGSQRFRRFGRHSKVRKRFTNTAGSPLSISKAGASKEEEGGDVDEVSIAMRVTLIMPEGFDCVTDSTATKETLRRLRHNYQAGDPSQDALDATKPAPPHPPKLTEVKKEEESKHRSILVVILKLLTHPMYPNKPSVLELEARLGRCQGKSGVPASPSSARAFKIPVSKDGEPLAFSEDEVVKTFRCICPGGGLSSLSLIHALEVASRGTFSVVEVELALVHLSTEKRKAEETQVAMAGQVFHWKLDLEKEVIRSTRRAFEWNELRKQLTAKEKEMEAAQDESTQGGYFLATLYATQEAPADFNLCLIHAAVDDTTSNNGPLKGDAGAANEQEKGEDKNGKDLEGAGEKATE